jgi:HEAT repeat protein
VPELILATVDNDPAVRRAAHDALNRVDPQWTGNPKAAGAAAGLIKRLDGRKLELQQEAHAWLCRLGTSVLADLVEALADDGRPIRQMWVARVIGQLGPDAAIAVPALAETLCSQPAFVREAAAEALGRIGQASGLAVPAVVALLADPDSSVRLAAARSLTRIGGLAAQQAVPWVIRLLPDREQEVRDAAIECLAAAGDAAVPLLVEFVGAKDFHGANELYRDALGRALQWHERAAGQLERDGAVLISCSPERAAELRREPLKALRNGGWSILASIVESDRIEAAREAAIVALGRIGVAAAGGDSSCARRWPRRAGGSAAPPPPP